MQAEAMIRLYDVLHWYIWLVWSCKTAIKFCCKLKLYFAQLN